MELMLEYHKVFRCNSCQVSGWLQHHRAKDHGRKDSLLKAAPWKWVAQFSTGEMLTSSTARDICPDILDNAVGIETPTVKRPPLCLCFRYRPLMACHQDERKMLLSARLHVLLQSTDVPVKSSRRNSYESC